MASDVLLQSTLFLDIIDPAKKFSLMSLGITEMVNQLDDMFLAYSIIKQGFERHPNTIFNLLHINKVISEIKVETDKKGITTFSYQDIKVDNYQCEKKSILENTTSYIKLILEALKKLFKGLLEENLPNEDTSGTPIAGDSILHDICQVLDSRKWIVPDGATPTIDVVKTVIEKNHISLKNIFHRFQLVLAKHVATE